MDEIVKIDLFGEEFQFKPDHQVKDPEGVVRYLTDYINEAQDSVRSKDSNRDKLVILLLAAMNLSKDYHELMQKHSELKRDVENKISSLMHKIEEGSIS